MGYSKKRRAAIKYSKQVSSRKHTNAVVVTNFLREFRIHPKRLSDLVHAILKKLGYRDTSLHLIFVSDAVIKRLNQRYLNHSWATDVLAFPFSNCMGAPEAVCTRSFLGEVVISPTRARVNSKRFQVLFVDELARYICHGILHLKGYSDHSHRAQAAMRRAEEELLKPLHSVIKALV